jgi:hypothetical protein
MIVAAAGERTETDCAGSGDNTERNVLPATPSGYTLYAPDLRHVTIYRGANEDGRLKYNHMAAVAHFSGRFYCAWSANPDTVAEGQANQRLMLATSDDFATWSEPVHFVNDGAGNPLPSDGVQSRPCFVNLGDELWCLWLNTSPDPERYGTYLTRLKHGPNAQWTNTRIMKLLQIGAHRCVVFTSQNGWVTRDGRVLVPATAYVRPAGSKDRLQWNICLYTDDGGRTWNSSDPISHPADFRAQWEPFFYEQADGALRGLMRNICNVGGTGIYAGPGQWMLTCVGTGAGKGTPLAFDTAPDYAWMETCAVRPFVMRLPGERYGMLLPDAYNAPGARIKHNGRKSQALALSRTGCNDFTVGIPINRPGVTSTCPQGLAHGGAIYIAQTVGDHGQPLSIEGVTITPAPPTATLCVMPRRKYMVQPDKLRPAPRAIVEEGRTRLHMRDSASAGVELPTVDFEAGKGVEIRFAAKVARLQRYGNLVFCSLGDRIPLRLCMPSYRRGKLFAAWADDRWFEIGNFPLNEWHTVTLSVWNESVAAAIDDGPPVAIPQPLTYFNPRLYLGDGYEIDYHQSNKGSVFEIDVTSMRARPLENLAAKAPLTRSNPRERRTRR